MSLRSGIGRKGRKRPQEPFKTVGILNLQTMPLLLLLKATGVRSMSSGIGLDSYKWGWSPISVTDWLCNLGFIFSLTQFSHLKSRDDNSLYLVV